MSKSKFGEWTSVTDATPESLQSVIGFVWLSGEDDGYPGEVYHWRGAWHSPRPGCEVTKITHWMPMPDGPDVAKAEGRA